MTMPLQGPYACSGACCHCLASYHVKNPCIRQSQFERLEQRTGLVPQLDPRTWASKGVQCRCPAHVISNEVDHWSRKHRWPTQHLPWLNATPAEPARSSLRCQWRNWILVNDTGLCRSIHCSSNSGVQWPPNSKARNRPFTLPARLCVCPTPTGIRSYRHHHWPGSAHRG